MAGKTVIAIAAAMGLSVMTGVALGQFAVTQPRALLEDSMIANQIGNPAAAYGPPPAVIDARARLNDGASLAPVCTGCGPTLAERRDAAYLGETYRPYDEGDTADYGDTEYTGHSATSVADPAPPPVQITTSE